MRNESRYSGTIRAIYADWPSYAFIYSGIVISLIIIGVSAQRSWIGLIPLSLALLIILLYFLFTLLWLAHLENDRNGLNPHHVLFDLGQIRADDSFVIIDLGIRTRAIDLARRLTTGKAIVVDVYNPQWTKNQALIRYRSRLQTPQSDPRLVWRNGSSNLLPLPDKSVTAVIVCQVMSEFWQEGDRLQLLLEIYRVLSENGRLLLAEQVRTRSTWLLKGPIALNLAPAEYWHGLLNRGGFRVRRQQVLNDIIYCIRADKPTFADARQLPLGFSDEE
jgi:SAM-dependent methyltransferase